jgi:K+-sensing histidine kinase KdpD
LRTSKRLAKEKKKAMAHIEHQSTVLTEIAYTQSHDIRGPISTILGLLELYNYEQSTDQLNNELVSGIAEVTARLDKIVTEIVNKENKLMEEGKETLNTDETEE